MGYVIQLTDTHLFIASEDKPAAFEVAKQHINTFGSLSELPWMNNARPSDWDGLEDAFSDWRFPAETDEKGHIVDLQFVGEKIGQEKEFFEAIAPYVSTGSYLEITGEDGAVWRYVFDENNVYRDDIN